MPNTQTITTLVQEIKFLRKDVKDLHYALLPEEHMSARELRDVRSTLKKMAQGKELLLSELTL